MPFLPFVTWVTDKVVFLCLYGGMSIWTISELDEQITEWKAALLAVANGQSYTGSGGQSFTMADLPEIRRTLRFLEAEKRNIQGTSGPARVSGRVRR